MFEVKLTEPRDEWRKQERAAEIRAAQKEKAIEQLCRKKSPLAWYAIKLCFFRPFRWLFRPVIRQYRDEVRMGCHVQLFIMGRLIGAFFLKDVEIIEALN